MSQSDAQRERVLWQLDQARIDPSEISEVDDMCRKPGRYGCGQCEACEAWADREMDA